MTEFFEGLDPLLKTYWYIALPTSIFFLLQTIMTFMGVGGDAELDIVEGHDSGDAPFELFSLRNLINFLLGFSWTGISLYNTIENKTFLIILSVVIGVIFIGLFFFIIKQILKLGEDNSFKFEQTINQTATVYLTIPESKSGVGKVQISVKGSVHELQAMTESVEKIPTGSVVKISAVENSILIVEKL
ncbi:NfeD family protein [Flavobacterium filum]|uniref:NfeD family protein n=2 Tax=Flavobacteriaceae TaxID=49546 RepID=UPI0004171304|nr:NfeD family protein [Flavobacterium filum]